MNDRNIQFSGQNAGFGMLQGQSQYVLPGMQRTIAPHGHMMPQGHVMPQGQMMPQGHMLPQGNVMPAQQMIPGHMMMAGHGMPHGQRMGMPPMNMMGARMPPTGAPPAYNQVMDNRPIRGGTKATHNRKTEEQMRKEKQFEQQRAKLKQFGKPSAAGLDPNKLIGSMFGGSEPKPRTKFLNDQPRSPATIPHTDTSDDVFGDFLGSPTQPDPQPVTSQTENSHSNDLGTSQNSTATIPVTVATIAASQPPPDLEKLMFQCSDLNAPHKAKLFHKPALKEIHAPHPATTGTSTHHSSQASRKWDQSAELSDLFITEAVKDSESRPVEPRRRRRSSSGSKHTSPTSKHPPKPPPWLCDEAALPDIYRHVLEASLVGGSISTERLHPILMLSGLPKDLMAHIWGLCNKVTPGQLTTPELFQILGLTALAQNNFQIVTADILSRCPQPPVPRFMAPGSQQIPPHQAGPIPGQGTQPIPNQGMQPIPNQGMQPNCNQGMQQIPNQVTNIIPNQQPQVIPNQPPTVIPNQGAQPIPNHGVLPLSSQGAQPIPASEMPPVSNQGTQPIPNRVSPVMLNQGPQLQVGQGTQSISNPMVHTSQNQGTHSMPNQVDPSKVPNLPGQGLQPMPLSNQGPQPFVIQGPQLSAHNLQRTLAMQSSPATLSVVQLPPAMVPQSMMGTVVSMEMQDDDFADFQAAPTPIQNSMVTQNSETRSMATCPPITTSPAEATLSPEEIKNNTVNTFFGSDDSSEEALSPNSLDDDYFDGYKSADSKPSDSTSTDQSESEDFKNFENYLDEFTKRKEKRDKESPLHRPVSKFSSKLSNSPNSPSKVFPVIQKLPAPGTNIVTGAASADEHSSDFADFQSAPLATTTTTTGTTIQNSRINLNIKQSVNQSDPLKLSGSASDLMLADEDKYAALRVLEIADTPSATGLGAMEASTTPSADEDNWADFQTANGDTDKCSDKNEEIATIQTDSNKTVSSWSQPNRIEHHSQNTESDWSAFAEVTMETSQAGSVINSDSNWNNGVLAMSATSTVNLSQPSLFLSSDSMSSPETSATNANSSKDTADGNEWAEFRTSNNDFADFQSSSGSTISDIKSDVQDKTQQLNQPSEVSVKKAGLGKNEILQLFKVKSEPLLQLKSRDDDVGNFSNSLGMENEIPAKVQSPENKSEEAAEKVDNDVVSIPSTVIIRKPRVSDADDDFMKPPPLDDMVDDEDEFGSYSRGYDFDDIMKPKPLESDMNRKNLYGLYGMNQQFVVSGRKKTETQTQKVDLKDTSVNSKVKIDIQIDEDSDSSKDNDSFQGKFTSSKDFDEDSQSIASLDFVTSKHRIKTLKDTENGDTQSVSSCEFSNFESPFPREILPESKSVDSLDLRQQDNCDPTSDTGDPTSDTNVSALEESGGSQDGQSDRETKEESPDTKESPTSDIFGTLDSVGMPGLPVIGDRYSTLLHDLPGSDKHMYEWQRCLVNCCRLIQDANNVFNSVSSSSVCNEIISSTQGSEYIQGIIEIYRVVCKITLSITQAGIHGDKLSQVLKDIDLSWNNLTAFLVGGSIMPDDSSLNFHHGALQSDDITSQYEACGICLLNVNMKTNGTNDNEGAGKLTYGRRQYHSSCANFWINCVDSTLPTLKLPQLL